MFPLNMGIKGAAIATGISQTIGLLIILVHFIRRGGVLRFGKAKFEKGLLQEIFLRGLPEGLGQLATPIMTLCMNFVLIKRIGDIGVNVFSIVTYVASFTSAVFFGCGEGLQPLFGQNYGAKKESDMRFYFKDGMLINFIGSIGVVALVLALGRPICVLFNSYPETLEYILQIMPLYSWGFVVMALNVMISAYLYSTERSGYAIIINFLRSIVVSVAVIMIFPMIFGSSIIWFTFGIYEAIILVISMLLLIRAEKNDRIN